jgi:hypothetical protein
MKRSRPTSLLTAAATVLLATGCASTLGFSTATKFGLDVSQQADQVINVSMGYDRAEVAAIPAPSNTDAGANDDAYSVIGVFDVAYDNPWTTAPPPLTLHQFFATGMAARKAASDPSLQQLFGRRAAEICGPPCEQNPAGAGAEEAP